MPAAVSEDGTTLTADVAGLGEPGALDVILVPAEPAVFRLVIGPPGEEALATSASSVELETLPSGDAFGEGDESSAGAPPFGEGFSSAPFDGSAGASALPPVGPLVPTDLPALPETSLDVAAPQVLSPEPELAPVAAPVLASGTNRVQVLFGLLFADVLLLWGWLLRKEQRLPRSLLALPGLARANSGNPPEAARGIGRFARVRSGPAVGV